MTDRNSKSASSEKEAAGIAAAELVKDGMVIGLGTGSTTAYTIAEIGRRVADGLDIKAVVTSYQSEMLAIEAGIPLTSLSQHPILDIAIDGVDQINKDFIAIKGGGAAQTREKVVAHSAKRFIIVADGSKLSDELDHFVPVEVLPYARELVKEQLSALGATPVIRMASKKDGPVVTDNGNFVIDAAFGKMEDPVEIGALISGCVGVVEHGIFNNIDEVYVGHKDGSVEILK